MLFTHRYAKLHGYDSHLWDTIFDKTRSPVWSAVGLPLSLVQKAKQEYDWVVALDCDMMFVNMEVSIEEVLEQYVPESSPDSKDVHLLITEDGRGLAGGAFLIRGSDEGRKLVESVYGTAVNHPYDRHDLKDQWSFLWHLMRPKA